MKREDSKPQLLAVPRPHRTCATSMHLQKLLDPAANLSRWDFEQAMRLPKTKSLSQAETWDPNQPTLVPLHFFTQLQVAVEKAKPNRRSSSGWTESVAQLARTSHSRSHGTIDWLFRPFLDVLGAGQAGSSAGPWTAQTNGPTVSNFSGDWPGRLGRLGRMLE